MLGQENKTSALSEAQADVIKEMALKIEQSAANLAEALEATYEEYRNFPRNSLLRAAGEIFAFLRVPPVNVALAAYIEGNLGRKAAATIQCSISTAQLWLNGTQKDWFAKYQEEYYDIDSSGAASLSGAFDTIVALQGKLIDLRGGVRELSTYTLNEIGETFCKNIWHDTNAMLEVLRNIGAILAKLASGISGLPTYVLVGAGVIVAVIFLTR